MITKSLKEYLDVLLYDRNIIGSSSEIFGYLRQSSISSETIVWPLDNFSRIFGNLRKIVRKVVISVFV